MDECGSEKDIDDSVTEADSSSELLNEFVNTYRYVSVLITLDRKYPHEHFEKIEQVLYKLSCRVGDDEMTDPNFPLDLMKKASEEMGYVTDSNNDDDSEEYYKAISGLLGRPEYEILMSNIYSNCDTNDEDIIKRLEGTLLKIYREMAIEDFNEPDVLDLLEYRLYEHLHCGDDNGADKTSNSI